MSIPFLKIVRTSSYPSQGSGVILEDVSNSAKLAPSQLGIIRSSLDTSVVLPNQVVYDPHQDFDAPISPGIITGRFAVKTRLGLDLPSAIDGFSDVLHGGVGKKVFIHAVSRFALDPFTVDSATYTCIARLTSCSIAWEGDFNTKHHFFADLSWRQFTDWKKGI